MRVATFNLHAGVDGWGRPTRAFETAVGLHPDVLICPETWRGDDGPDLHSDLARELAMDGLFVPLARAERVTSGTGGRSWQPLLAHFTGEHGLYFREHRTLGPSQLARRVVHDVEHGEWGLSVLTSLEIEEIHAEALERLSRERVNRALIVATLREDDRRFQLVAVHGAHLSHGSYRQYRRMREIIKTLDPNLPTILGGDFNSWRPLLRLVLPGWRTLVRARTWPARRPHSQIDHLLARGAWRRTGGGSIDGGSDHRALFADVTLA